MNKTRRKRLAEIMEILEGVKSDLQDIVDEEDEMRDNMPENLWGAERYTRSEDASQSMDEAIGWICDAIECIEEASE